MAILTRTSIKSAIKTFFNHFTGIERNPAYINRVHIDGTLKETPYGFKFDAQMEHEDIDMDFFITMKIELTINGLIMSIIVLDESYDDICEVFLYSNIRQRTFYQKQFQQRINSIFSAIDNYEPQTAPDGQYQNTQVAPVA